MKTEKPTTDPICGMAVDPQTALSSSKDGETFYFCSAHCQNKFKDQSAAELEKDDLSGIVNAIQLSPDTLSNAFGAPIPPDSSSCSLLLQLSSAS